MVLGYCPCPFYTIILEVRGTTARTQSNNYQIIYLFFLGKFIKGKHELKENQEFFLGGGGGSGGQNLNREKNRSGLGE